MSENNDRTCQRSQFTQMTEARIKEITMETLIELGLVPQPQKKKLMQ